MGLLIGDLLADAAAVAPAATAATLGDQRVSYADLDGQANRTARALRDLGVGPGDLVAWWTGPTLGSIACFAAAARLGAVFAPMNPALGESEAAGVVDYLQPRLLVSDRPGALALSELDAAASRCSPDPPSPLALLSDGDPHVVYLTSGTTGTPKGVMVSHRASWLRSFPGGSTFAVGLHGRGGILASFPLFHYGGWHYVLEAWHHRCATHLSERYDGPSLLAVAERHRPTGMYCIPAVWDRVLDALGDGRQLDSVRHADTGTSAAPPELLARLRGRLPAATTSVLYGSSEGGHHTTLADWDIDAKPGSVGRVAPPGVIRCSPEGEILYRSPTVMLGYLHLPAESDTALRGGWYHTGDLGEIDDDGYVYVTGRAREVIRTGGESVAPPEVEAALAGLPGVLDVAVVGLPDDRWGEIVCAVVVPSPGTAAPSAADVRDHLAGKLASYKHPRRVVAAENIPRTAATGQVQRTLLRDRIARL